MDTVVVERIIRNALNDGVTLELWIYLLILMVSVFGGVIGSYFGSYLKKRGESLAIKQDIKDITNKIGEVEEFFDKRLEEFRSAQALHVEFTKQRVIKIAECWAAINIYHDKFQRLNDALKELIDNLKDQNEEEINKLIKKIFRKRFIKEYKLFTKANTILETNRFWMGTELYDVAKEYHHCFFDYHKAFQRYDHGYFFTCEEEIKRTREDVFSTLKKLGLY